MFTGLIKCLGTTHSKKINESGIIFGFQAPSLTSGLSIGESIAINGVCLTVTSIQEDLFFVQGVHVTVEKTSLSNLVIGSKVNLELPLKANDGLGGHFVQGHVNGLATIQKIEQRGENYECTLEVPESLRKYLILEGSIALDGISLTIARLHKNNITISIIPHTWQETNLQYKNIGDRVNVEVDVLAKYIEKLINPKQMQL